MTFLHCLQHWFIFLYFLMAKYNYFFIFLAALAHHLLADELICLQSCLLALCSSSGICLYWQLHMLGFTSCIPKSLRKSRGCSTFSECHRRVPLASILCSTWEELAHIFSGFPDFDCLITTCLKYFTTCYEFISHFILITNNILYTDSWNHKTLSGTKVNGRCHKKALS